MQAVILQASEGFWANLTIHKKRYIMRCNKLKEMCIWERMPFKYMGAWDKLKQKIKNKLPAGRAYLDKRLDLVLQQQEQIMELLKQLDKNEQLQAKAVNSVKKYVDQELTRRDEWPKQQAEHRRAADGRMFWAIKCPAPGDERKVKWGDYPYARSLQKYLERLGYYVVIDFREDWNCEEQADVVLVLRGKHFYIPDRRNKKCFYIMWNISHPEQVTKEEYQLYDVVCVASETYAKRLQGEITVPVVPLLQCTDTEEFFPADSQSGEKHEYIFVGNTRGQVRQGVVWAAQEGLPVTIYGSGWGKVLPDAKKLVRGDSIEDSRLPELYRSSRVALNDHWEDMKANGFVNNRVFDALACGLPVISDGSRELQNIFPEAVLYYGNREEFKQCVKRIESEYDTIRENVKSQWEFIQTKYSFEARAKELAEIVTKYKNV